MTVGFNRSPQPLRHISTPPRARASGFAVNEPHSGEEMLQRLNSTWQLPLRHGERGRCRVVDRKTRICVLLSDFDNWWRRAFGKCLLLEKHVDPRVLSSAASVLFAESSVRIAWAAPTPQHKRAILPCIDVSWTAFSVAKAKMIHLRSAAVSNACRNEPPGSCRYKYLHNKLSKHCHCWRSAM